MFVLALEAQCKRETTGHGFSTPWHVVVLAGLNRRHLIHEASGSPFGFLLWKAVIDICSLQRVRVDCARRSKYLKIVLVRMVF
jgi:hypothetical protein